jgi:SPOR domain
MMQAPVERSRAAIEECRARRQRGELKTYKESAQCSNPQIFAAWKATNYPHMDLITAWLDARESESEKVDQKVITPEQFERDMDALTLRLTAEERRRRTGYVSAADSDLSLQLPPPTKVLGVVTPAAQDKQSAKKSAEARSRAAQTPFDAASGPNTVGALSSLNSPKPRPGVGGPFVPVDPNSPAARAAMAAAAPGEGSSGLYAQLAAQRSEAEARVTFRGLQSQFPGILGTRNAVIRRADVANQGTFYRVEVGPLSSGQADELCGNLKAAGAQCIARYE